MCISKSNEMLGDLEHHRMGICSPKRKQKQLNGSDCPQRKHTSARKNLHQMSALHPPECLSEINTT